jgi:hypothetical protein
MARALQASEEKHLLASARDEEMARALQKEDEDEGFASRLRDETFAQEIEVDDRKKVLRAQEERAGLEMASFIVVRNEFPSAAELGGFGDESLCLSDSTIRAGLVEHDFNAQDTIVYLRGIVERNYRVQQIALNKLVAERSRYAVSVRSNMIGRDMLLRDARSAGSRSKNVQCPSLTEATAGHLTRLRSACDVSGREGEENADADVAEQAMRTLQAHAINRSSGVLLRVDPGGYLRCHGFSLPADKVSLDNFSQLPKAYQVDMHGAMVREGLQLVHSLLDLRKTGGHGFDSSAAIALLVGKGIHSDGGRARLGPGICRVLQKLKVLHNAGGAWVVIPAQKKGH